MLNKQSARTVFRIVTVRRTSRPLRLLGVWSHVAKAHRLDKLFEIICVNETYGNIMTAYQQGSILVDFGYLRAVHLAVTKSYGSILENIALNKLMNHNKWDMSINGRSVRQMTNHSSRND